jgi:hypothetical protein
VEVKAVSTTGIVLTVGPLNGVFTSTDWMFLTLGYMNFNKNHEFKFFYAPYNNLGAVKTVC